MPRDRDGGWEIVSQLPKSTLFWGAVMWKKWLAFTGVLALIILLDPTHTPGQPPGGGGKGFGKGGFGGPGTGGPGSSGMYPGTGGPGTGGPGSGGFGRPRPDGSTAAPGAPGMGGPGMGGPGMGGPGAGGGGMNRGGSDPERSWSMLQRLTQSNSDTVDLSKIPAESRPWLKSMAEKSGATPLPEAGVWTKATFLEFHAKNEAAKAAFAASGGSGAGGPVTMTMTPDGAMMGGRGMGMGGRGMGMGMGDPNGWGQGGWGQGGWDPTGQGGWGNRPPFEKKDTEEERPVAMRYGKLPKDLPSWFDELDVDKDGQVSLYEYRKSSKDTKEALTKEFMEMDLNGDGLVTADEYLRFARLKDVGAKVKAYEDSEGADRPKNWGLGSPVDAKGDGKGGGKGPWGGPGGGWPGGPGSKGGDKGNGDKGNGDKGNGDKNKDEKGKGNPWGKRP